MEIGMLEYYGDMEELKREIDGSRKELEDIYRRILGDHYDTVDQMSRHLLVPEAFRPVQMGKKSRHSTNTVEGDNLQVVMMPLEDVSRVSIGSNGRVQVNGDKRLKTAPQILMSRAAIDSLRRVRPEYPPYLTPYLHEYAHFLTYCLQRTPAQVAANIITNHFASAGYDVSNRNYLIDVARLNTPPDNAEKQHAVETAMTQIALDTFMENSAEYLTKLSLGMLGYDTKSYLMVDNPESGPHRQYMEMEQRTVPEAMKYIRSWNQILHPASEFRTNFYRSLEALKVQKCPMTDFYAGN